MSASRSTETLPAEEPAAVRIGAVALTVRDLDTVARFYREAIGLAPVEASAGLVRLGIDGTVLLELRHDPAAAPASRREAGLFHTAFLVPTRADLGQWLLNAANRGVVLQGASDHRVSEAIYLADPEGNGIEMYWDRPRDTWSWRDGMVEMATLALDVEALAAAARPGAWTGLPAGSRIGHVHLQVGALEPAERFYAGVLGLDVACRYPGATFFSSGGYHHHIATNVWNSRGAAQRPQATTGLAEIRLDAAPDAMAAIRSRLADGAMGGDGARLVLRDPWGTALVLQDA